MVSCAGGESQVGAKELRSPAQSTACSSRSRSGWRSEASRGSSSTVPSSHHSSFVDSEEDHEPENSIAQQDEDKFNELADAGVADELIASWAATEAKVLAVAEAALLRREALRRLSAPLAARARAAALMCLHSTLEELQLPLEAWHDAVATFDAYITHAECAGKEVGVADLPILCAVLARMEWKEHSTHRRLKPRFLATAPWVAEQLSAAGFEVALTSPVTEHTLMLAEMELLQTMQWRVLVPSLAKWAIAFFERLALSLDDGQKERAGAARSQILQRAQDVMMQQALAPDCPPQRLARGLVLLQACEARLLPSGQPVVAAAAEPTAEQGPRPLPSTALAEYLRRFEVVMAAPLHVLHEDCQLATRTLLGAGEDTAAAHNVPRCQFVSGPAFVRLAP